VKLFIFLIAPILPGFLAKQGLFLFPLFKNG